MTDSFRPAACACAIRSLAQNGFTGPILASITALTRLVDLYAPLPPCGLPAESGARTGTWWRRSLAENRFTGSLPPTISTLTTLRRLYASMPALQRMEFTANRLSLKLSFKSDCGCRSLDGNRLEGRATVLLALNLPGGLSYAPPPASSLKPATPSPARVW